MTKAQLETKLRNECLELLHETLDNKYGCDVLPVSASEIALPVTDAEGNEKWILIKVSIPRGTRNGAGGYDPYDGYAVTLRRKRRRRKPPKPRNRRRLPVTKPNVPKRKRSQRRTKTSKSCGRFRSLPKRSDLISFSYCNTLAYKSGPARNPKIGIDFYPYI